MTRFFGNTCEIIETNALHKGYRYNCGRAREMYIKKEIFQKYLFPDVKRIIIHTEIILSFCNFTTKFFFQNFCFQSPGDNGHARARAARKQGGVERADTKGRSQERRVYAGIRMGDGAACRLTHMIA